MKHPRVLCVCRMGQNRSKYLAKYLKGKGYNTRYGGVGHGRIDKIAHTPINQKDVDWADIIIVVRKPLNKYLKKEYKVSKKKIIVIDVTDSRRIIGEKFPELAELSREELNKRWVYPQLRKAIKPYLPLKF